MITINFRDTNIEKYSSENKNGNICENFLPVLDLPISTAIINNIEYNFLCLVSNYRIELEIDSNGFLDYEAIIINNRHYILFTEIYFGKKWCIQCDENTNIKIYHHFMGYDWNPCNFHTEIPMWIEENIHKNDYLIKKYEILYYSGSV
jgi:hypothetical protein